MISSSMRTWIRKTKYWYEDAKQKQQLSFWIIYLVAIYLPFEEFFIKFTPLRGGILFLFRQITGELIIYALLLKIIYESIFRGRTFRTTPVDPLFIAFIVASFISIGVNQASIAGALVNLRPLLRYVAVYYLIVNLEISKQQLTLLLKSLRIICLIQSVIASIQYFAPRSITKFFVPRGTGVAFGGHERYMSKTKVGAAVGTIGRPAALTTFIFIGFAVFLSDIFRKSSKFIFTGKGLLWSLVVFFGIFATLKRASLIIILLLPVVLLLHLGKTKKALIVGWFYAAFAFGLALTLLSINLDGISFSGSQAKTESIDTSSYLVQIFTPDYWEQANENSRGWTLRTVGSSVLRSGEFWFGLSPDQNFVRDALIELNPADTLAQQRFEVSEALEDVYWIAMFAYYGIVGLGIYFSILVRLYLAGRWLTLNSDDPDYQSLGAIFCSIILVAFVYGWIERLWEVKVFSFYFWLLAGLVINSCSAAKETRRLRSEKKL